MTTPPPGTPHVSVNVQAAGETPFGIEAQIGELKRRLTDVENEILDLKGKHSSLQARDATFEARIAELVVSKEQLERLLQTIERKFADFTQTVQDQQKELKSQVSDISRIVTWRSIGMTVAAFFGGAALRLLEHIIPNLK
jgi:chromosome segregation ATPase